MEFKEYREQFSSYGKINNLDSIQIEKYLLYAERLFDLKLPVIYDQQHFCDLIGIDSEYIYRACNKSKLFYRKFQIKKKNGKKRTIYEPLPTLKKAQYYILNEILLKIDSSVYSKAYKKKISIKDNVKFHKKQKYVLNIDIEDYFGSISWYKVYQKLQDCGYNDEVAMIIAKLCTLNGSLPQGAPTSPQLSNILTQSLDDKLAKLSKTYKVRYTRYADDITFSGEFNPQEIIKKSTQILYTEGFMVNREKTRVATKSNRQVVTGIVVNQKAQVNKNKRKEIRQKVYFINKYGVESHLLHTNNNQTPEKYLQSLFGQIGYASFINPKDKELLEYKNQIKTLINNYKANGIP